MEKCLSCFPVKCPVKGGGEVQLVKKQTKNPQAVKSKLYWEEKQKRKNVMFSCTALGKGLQIYPPRELQPGVGHFMLKL